MQVLSNPPPDGGGQRLRRKAWALAGTAAAAFAVWIADGSAHPGTIGVTWTTGAARILQNRCVGCHGPSGNVSPRLDEYEPARLACTGNQTGGSLAAHAALVSRRRVRRVPKRSDADLERNRVAGPVGRRTRATRGRGAGLGRTPARDRARAPARCPHDARQVPHRGGIAYLRARDRTRHRSVDSRLDIRARNPRAHHRSGVVVVLRRHARNLDAVGRRLPA